MSRRTWDQVFMDKANDISTMSTCLRRHVGAVIVRDNRTIAEGYNASPTKAAHCTDIGCMRQQNNIPSGTRIEECRGVHGEQNALMQAAKFGVSVDKATLYVNCRPCSLCAKMIVNSGISKVVYAGDYPDELTTRIFMEAPWIKIIQYKEERTI